MAELKTDALIKSLESLVAEKESVTSREKELVDKLNAVLSRMGYRVMPTDAVVKRRGRPPGSKARRPGRPKGSGNGRRRRRGPGRPAKAKIVKNRRGRSPKEPKES